LERLREGILRRIHLLPDGGRHYAEVEQNSRAAETAFGRAPWLTLAFVTSLVLFYTLVGAGDETLDDVFPFANVPGLVARGELFRLMTASWGHTSLDHLRANAVVLLVYGWVLEPIVGRPRMLLIGFASTFLASMSFLVASPAPFLSAVGSSAWALGWLGCGLALRILRASSLPPMLRMRAPWAGSALLALLQLGSDEVSVTVQHALGLAVGLVSAPLLVRKHASRAPEQGGRERAIDVAAKASLVVIACAFGWAGLAAALRGERDRSLVTRWVLEDATVAAAILNDTAWAAAIDPDASPDRLALAERSVRRALELEPENPNFIGTFATVLYRRGELDQAVENAWKRVGRLQDSFALEQAARFELARQREQGVLRNGAGSEGEVELEWVALGSEPPRLRLRAKAPLADGLAVHAVAVRSGTPAGHVRAWIGRPLLPGEPLDLEIPPQAESAFPGAQLVLTRIEVPSGIASREVRSEIHAFESHTAGLP
jgi:membrane associated rhomboid family serine protease